MPAWSFACIDLIAVHSEIYWRVCIEELTVKVTNVLMCGSKNLQMKLFSRHGMYSKWANARGKPRRSAKHGGHPQAELVGVGLTNRLGWEAEMR